MNCKVYFRITTMPISAQGCAGRPNGRLQVNPRQHVRGTPANLSQSAHSAGRRIAPGHMSNMKVPGYPRTR
jgi:hypothetical protein